MGGSVKSISGIPAPVEFSTPEFNSLNLASANCFNSFRIIPRFLFSSGDIFLRSANSRAITPFLLMYFDRKSSRDARSVDLNFLIWSSIALAFSIMGRNFGGESFYNQTIQNHTENNGK